MSETPLLADLLKDHLASTGSSARALAEKLDASYPSVLAWISKGGVPRKPEHRHALRRELALAPDVFARVLAASSKDPIDIPNAGPLDLRQLLLRHLGERNLTERTFADLANIPYATLMGITRRGAVPRGSTLEQLAQAMGLPIDLVREAALLTRGEAEAAGHEVEVTAEHEPIQHVVEVASTAEAMPTAEIPTAGSNGELARVANEMVAASGLSAAAYARTHELPYLALSRLLATGVASENAEVNARLCAAFPVPVAPHTPTPAQPAPVIAPTEEGSRALFRAGGHVVADHPLHEALLRLCRERGWSQQKFAQVSGLAVPTASKLLKGELPGRGPTHQKLREVLGLDAAAYCALLPPSPQGAEEPAVPHRPAAKPATEEDPEVLKLCRAVNDLDANQRAAVWQLVKTFRGR